MSVHILFLLGLAAACPILKCDTNNTLDNDVCAEVIENEVYVRKCDNGCNFADVVNAVNSGKKKVMCGVRSREEWNIPETAIDGLMNQIVAQYDGDYFVNLTMSQFCTPEQKSCDLRGDWQCPPNKWSSNYYNDLVVAAQRGQFEQVFAESLKMSWWPAETILDSSSFDCAADYFEDWKIYKNFKNGILKWESERTTVAVASTVVFGTSLMAFLALTLL